MPALSCCSLAQEARRASQSAVLPPPVIQPSPTPGVVVRSMDRSRVSRVPHGPLAFPKGPEPQPFPCPLQICQERDFTVWAHSVKRNCCLLMAWGASAGVRLLEARFGRDSVSLPRLSSPSALLGVARSQSVPRDRVSLSWDGSMLETILA